MWMDEQLNLLGLCCFGRLVLKDDLCDLMHYSMSFSFIEKTFSSRWIDKILHAFCGPSVPNPRQLGSREVRRSQVGGEQSPKGEMQGGAKEDLVHLKQARVKGGCGCLLHRRQGPTHDRWWLLLLLAAAPFCEDHRSWWLKM